jgi:PKD repeat protein/flagellar hook assembly protein FlgD
VQISSDGGQTWNTLRTFNGYDQDDWKYEKVDISSSYSGKSDLKFRFYLDARGYTGDGWYIDDVTIDGGVTGYDGSGKNPTHTYEKAGTFNPVLRVTDDEGNEDFFAVPIKAKTPPTVTILDPTNLYDISMRNILFSGTGRDPDGTIVLYEWDFNGDGIFDWSSTNQGTTLHDLDINGTYTAMFRVTDNDGLTGNATVAFNTVAMPPANLQAGVERTSRDTFAFTGFAQDGDGHIVKYEWDFDGDGNPDWGSAGPGKVVSFTSQYNTSSRAAKNLIDGKIKESDSNGWSSTGAPVVPQEIVFELAGNQVWSVDALRVNPATTGGTDRWAKEIQVLVSSTGLRANDFSLVSESGTFVLANEDRFQIFGFDPVQARYVKLRVLSNYGNSAEVQLGEFDVLSGHLSLLSPLTASTSHQYATPGEYTAVLKATDDEGLVATIDAKSVKSLPDDQIQAAVSALPDPVATGQAISLRGFGVYDDFSNSTTIGTRWTSPTDLNDWTIIDGQLRQNTDNGGGPEKLNYGRYVVAGNATWQDYVLRARIYSTDNDSMGLIVRYQNEGAYYLFEWNRQSSCRRLLKRTANATEILAEDAVGYEYNQWYEINVDVQGSRIRVEVDGNQVFDVTDSSYGQGKVGLWSNYNRYTYFDDISLTWPEISKYEWDFEGDGIYDWSSTTIGSTVHSYDLPTLYEPIFRLTDTQGRTETIQKSIQVVAAADTAPYAWVIDKYNHRIVQLDALGERILKTVQGFSYPGAIDVDWKDGTIWVCDASNYRVVRLDASVPDGYDLRYDRGHHAVFTNYSDLNTHSPETLVVNQSTGDCTTLWNYSEITTMPADADSRELGIPLQGTVSACGSGAPVGQVYGEYNNTDGALGKGLYLGDGSYLKLPHTTLDGRGDFAFELWFKTPTSPTGNMSLVSGAALDNDNAFLLDLSKDGTKIYLYTMGDSTKTFNIPGVNNDQFHHLAFVRSNSTGTLYIDGTDSGSQSMTNASLTIDPGGLIIGQEQDQVGGRFDRYNQLKGWVDDIRVWSRALSSEEIDTNKDKALTGTESGLAGYWSCDTVTPAQDNVRIVSGFSNPVAIDVRNADQSLWVADTLTDKLFHILANATLRYDVATQTDSHFEWAGLSLPVGLAVDQNDGSCWVGDSGRDRVYKFDSQANKLLELRADANYVDVDQKDSSVWFSDSTAKEIFHCDASGTKAGSSVLSGATISSLAVDPTTGICWLTDSQNDAVIRLAPGGGLLSENKGFNNPADVAAPSMCLQDNPPVIDSASTDVSEGTGETLVTFSADVSDNTGVTFYQWDFNGDGRVDYSSATSGNTSYTYIEPGLYRPVLTVMDGEGNTSSTTLEPVIIGPGYATIEVDKSSGPASLTVKFTGSGFDPKGGMLEYAWDDDNDGTFEYVSQSFSKTFYDSGEYPVLLRVKGNSGYFYDEIVISVLSSPPTVSCSASPVSGEPPLVVNLKGSASDADGSLVLYQWDFEGDGIFDWSSSTSTEVNHVYTKAGMYTPVFRAVDDDGDMATAMKAIIVNSLPKAAFSLNATRGNAPMAVTAQASNASDVDGNIADYTWYLDGIQTSQGEQAVFSGLTAGIHTIKLKVVDAYGETSESQEQIEVLAAGMPIAVARVAEDEVMFPESVSLRGDASTANGTIVSHEWQYGLGYFLNANGYPTHQLLIGKWDSANCNDFSKHIPGLESRNPYPGSGVDGRIWIEAHDEDGNFDWNEKLGSSYNDFGYSHIYVYAQEEQNARILFGADDAARFWVNQELVYTKDACGGVVIDSHQADIFLKQGWNRILAQVVNGSGGWGLAYRLVDASDNPLHLPYSLVVPTGVPDYSGQGANLDHVYLPGRYTAELTVIDDQNNTDSNEVSFTVLPPDGGGVIEALVDPAEADAPFTAHFDATIDSSITPTLYEWDFDGDMVFDSSSTESVQTEHVFREKALINVTLHVRDSQGNDYYDSVEINAGGITPVAIPVAYPTTGTAPLRVKFSTNGYDADNTINRYEWDFNGDGIFDKFVTPGENLSGYPDYQPIAMTTEYTYHAPGTYNATLKVTDHDGYSSSANITIVVQAAEAPELALKADTTSGETPLTVNFRAEASASANSIAGYRWDFGEGSGFGDLQAESLVPHIYADPGIYTAQVMAVDDRSASATRDLTIFVLEDGAPEVSATASTDSGEGDLGVVLDAEVTSSDDDPITAYEWDFDGDGQYDWSSTDSPTVAHIYSDPGEYDAVLKTTTQSGKIGYDQLHIAVEPSFKVWRGRESFDPTLGETMPLTLATSMEMKLLEFNVIDRVGTLVKRLDVNKTVSPGIYNYTWDGRDTAGNIVGSGVFYFIARYEINGKVYEFDLTNSEGFDRQTYGDHTDGKNYQTSFNPFSGEPLDIRLELPKPAEVCIYVYDWNSKEDIRTILLREPMTSGSKVVQWDGAQDDGTLISSSTSYTMSMSYWILSDNAMIVQSRPQVSQLLTYPHYFNPSFNPYLEDPSLSIDFSLSKSSDVLVHIVDGFNTVVRVIEGKNLPAGANTLHWDGRNEKGLLPMPGFYRARIKAKDKAGNESIPFNSIFNLFY